jgi:hypothetical protein
MKFNHDALVKFRQWAIISVWIACVTYGGIQLNEYEQRPGKDVPPAVTWPNRSTLSRSPTLPTLVVFVHEECPCTRASMTELQVIGTRCRKRLSIIVAFVNEGVTKPIIGSSLWQAAKAVPSAVVVKVQPQEASLFGATTSGFTALYDVSGHLVYSGGVTSQRGHEGDNACVDAIIAFVNHGASDFKRAPTFGCALFNEIGSENKPTN